MVRLAGVLTVVLAVAAACGKKGETDNSYEPTPEQKAAVEAENRVSDSESMSAPGAAFEDLVVEVETTDGGHEVTVTVARKAGETPREGIVSVSAEPISLATKVMGEEVAEADLFGTGLAYDLNGDGDTDDTLPLACDGKAAVVGDTTIQPAMADGIQKVSVWEYDGRIQRMGDNGAHVLLYTPCSANQVVTFGLSAPDRPIEMARVAGPALQLIVFEPAKPGSEPQHQIESVALDGEAVDTPIYTAHAFEPVVTTEPAWHGLRWLLVPLDPAKASQEVTLLVEGDGSEPRMVSASIQEVGEDADRARSHVAGSLLP